MRSEPIELIDGIDNDDRHEDVDARQYPALAQGSDIVSPGNWEARTNRRVMLPLLDIPLQTVLPLVV